MIGSSPCSNTLSSLVEESGCPKAATFRTHVIDGEWDLVSEEFWNGIWSILGKSWQELRGWRFAKM